MKYITFPSGVLSEKQLNSELTRIDKIIAVIDTYIGQANDALEKNQRQNQDMPSQMPTPTIIS